MLKGHSCVDFMDVIMGDVPVDGHTAGNSTLTIVTLFPVHPIPEEPSVIPALIT